jgi:hypothetical protein
MNPYASLRQILQSSLINDKPQYKEIVAEDQLDQLEKYAFVKDECEYDCCPISMKTFEEGEEITKLECGHIFDTESITKWVTTEKASCPVCRFKLKCKQVRITQAGDSQESEVVDASNNNVASGNASRYASSYAYPRESIGDVFAEAVSALISGAPQNDLATAIISNYILRSGIATNNIDEHSESGTDSAAGESNEAVSSTAAASDTAASVTASANNSNIQNFYSSIINRQIHNRINRTRSNMMNYRRTYGMNSYISNSDVALQQAIMESMGANNEVVDSSGNE